jgi:hypothetical protein
MKDSEHGFYARPEREQKWILIRLGALAVLANVLLAAGSLLLGLYFLPVFFIALTLSLMAPFFDTPALKRRGRLIYYSPLFITEKENDGVIKVHGGTLFDYVFVIDRRLNGKQRTNQVLIGYLDGILNLLEQHRDRDLSEYRIKGTSYIINERTAARVGLEKVDTSFVQMVILVYNYANLTASYSISRARLSFPRISQISTFAGNLSDIEANTDYLIRLRERLAKYME